MDRETQRMIIEALTSTSFVEGVIPVLREKLDRKVKELIVGSEKDNYDRGWINCINWILDLKRRTREEVNAFERTKQR